jgi:hypothetical protein
LSGLATKLDPIDRRVSISPKEAIAASTSSFMLLLTMDALKNALVITPSNFHILRWLTGTTPFGKSHLVPKEAQGIAVRKTQVFSCHTYAPLPIHLIGKHAVESE